MPAAAHPDAIKAEVKVAVVIPYFQREAGILRRALDSVAAQELPENARLHCLIVDDGSPHPADGECPPATDGKVSYEIIRQPNGGVSAARNAALDRLPPDTDFVACLDSDDQWAPGHIATALSALSPAVDFYFANSRVEEGLDWFSTIPGFSDLVSKRSGGAGLAVFDAEELIPAFLSDCPSHTSSVVYRAGPFRDLRFDRTLRSAGEDHLFWFDLVRRAAKVAVNPEETTSRGHGVDLYRSAQSWDSPECMARLCGNVLKHRRLGARVAQAEFRSEVRRQLDLVRQELLIVMLRAAPRMPGRVANSLAFLWRHDKPFFLLIGRNGLTLLQRKRRTGQFV